MGRLLPPVLTKAVLGINKLHPFLRVLVILSSPLIPAILKPVKLVMVTCRLLRVTVLGPVVATRVPVIINKLGLDTNTNIRLSPRLRLHPLVIIPDSIREEEEVLQCSQQLLP